MPDDARETGIEAELAGRRSDSADFESLLRGCQRLVFRVAFGVLADHAEAEEVTQEVFLRAYRKLSSLRDAGRFRAWVARMSWRLALNRRRSIERARRRETGWWQSRAAEPADVETLAAGRESQQRLLAEMNRLPEKLRVVLLLSAVENLETREIADILDIPEGTVRSRLHLARKELLRVFSNEPM